MAEKGGRQPAQRVLGLVVYINSSIIYGSRSVLFHVNNVKQES